MRWIYLDLAKNKENGPVIAKVGDNVNLIKKSDIRLIKSD